LKKTILTLCAATVLVPGAFAARMICTNTDKEVKACCCDIKDGKFVCKMTKKVQKKCCCDSKA
jgi:hypothetical protein